MKRNKRVRNQNLRKMLQWTEMKYENKLFKKMITFASFVVNKERICTSQNASTLLAINVGKHG